MKLYLVRHGDYLADASNPMGALSEKGKKDIQHLADFLKSASIRVSGIFHSGKLRTEQTAELLAPGLHFTGKVTQHPGLKPLDDVNIIADEVDIMKEDVLLVGHLPFMGRLAAKLVTGDENKFIVNFETGTMICLEQWESKYWAINWMINTNLFK